MRGLQVQADEVITEAFTTLEPVVGIKPACKLTGRVRATVYRQCHPKSPVAGPRRAPAADSRGTTSQLTALERGQRIVFAGDEGSA